MSIILHTVITAAAAAAATEYLLVATTVHDVTVCVHHRHS